MAVFTTVTKQALSWPAPAPTATAPTATVAEVDFLFSGSSDFLFSDSGDYVFLERVGRQDTNWTQLTKSR